MKQEGAVSGEEIICAWMGWRVTKLTPARIWEVEERLTGTKDVSRYDTELRNVAPGPGWTWHVRADQKIRALAAVLRLTVETNRYSVK